VVGSGEWVFIIGVSAWRGLGEYMALEKTFYNLFEGTGLNPPPPPSYFHIFFLFAFLEEAFVRNM
jgi:hypothetical protein